jgi:hypothetical protein
MSISIRDLQIQIEKELKIDNNHLDFCASENPIIIQKYINRFLFESKALNKLQKEFDILYSERTTFYKRDYKLVPETVRELTTLVDGDIKIAEAKEKISNQAMLVKFVSETITNFRDRGWAIKYMIEFRKFMAGE